MQKTRIDRFKLKQAMRGRYSTLEDLANAAHISPTTLSTGTDSYAWRSSTLDAIANALGISPLSLLTVDDADQSPASQPTQAEQAAPSTATQLRVQEHSALPGLSLTPEEQARAQQMEERRAALLAQARQRNAPE